MVLSFLYFHLLTLLPIVLDCKYTNCYLNKQVKTIKKLNFRKLF